MKKVLGAVLTVGLLATVSSAAVLVIDDFSDGSTNLLLTSAGTTSTTDGVYASIRGGTRETTIQHHGYTGGATIGDVSAIQDTIAETMNLSSATQTLGSWMLEYGETFNSGTDLGDVTLLDTLTSIVVSVVFADAGITVEVTALDNDNDSDTVSKDTPAGGVVNDILEFKFSEFAAAVDFDDLDSLRIFIDASDDPAVDFTIDMISTGTPDIPEPVTMSMLALGGLGLLLRRRRA